jgi:hypothetical protein
MHSPGSPFEGAGDEDEEVDVGGGTPGDGSEREASFAGELVLEDEEDVVGAGGEDGEEGEGDGARDSSESQAAVTRRSDEIVKKRRSAEGIALATCTARSGARARISTRVRGEPHDSQVHCGVTGRSRSRQRREGPTL